MFSGLFDLNFGIHWFFHNVSTFTVTVRTRGIAEGRHRRRTPPSSPPASQGRIKKLRIRRCGAKHCDNLMRLTARRHCPRAQT
jgi:hypothetical protein